VVDFIVISSTHYPGGRLNKKLKLLILENKILAILIYLLPIHHHVMHIYDNYRTYKRKSESFSYEYVT